MLHWQHVVPWQIEAEGRQCRQMCQVDKRGFPRSRAKEQSRVHGFRTGDQVRAVCPAHLKTAGDHVGRVLVRATGWFDVVTATRRVGSIFWRRCQRLRAAGWVHLSSGTASASSPGLKSGASALEKG